MKKTTYAIIAVILFILVGILGLILLVRSTGHPREKECYTNTYEETTPIEVGTLTVEVHDDWYLSLPYGTTLDSASYDNTPYQADTLIIIAPAGSIHVR